MTRSYKANDRDHAGIAAGSASPQERLPRYFAKSGALDTDPKSVKKEGNGKGNWGSPGTEVQDYGYNFSPSLTRRRSNSSATGDLNDFKTKFELDDEPVFEEEIHGPIADNKAESESGSGSAAGAGVGIGIGLGVGGMREMNRVDTGSSSGSFESSGSEEGSTWGNGWGVDFGGNGTNGSGINDGEGKL